MDIFEIINQLKQNTNRYKEISDYEYTRGVNQGYDQCINDLKLKIQRLIVPTESKFVAYIGQKCYLRDDLREYTIIHINENCTECIVEKKLWYFFNHRSLVDTNDVILI